MFKKIIPYILGVTYLIYTLTNIEPRIKQHFDVRGEILLPFVLAAIICVFNFVQEKRKNKQKDYWLPIFFICIGVIIVIFSSNITCCTGG